MDKHIFYQIRIKGHLDDTMAGWFEDLTITNLEGGDALLSGPLPDQAALQGTLKRISNLGLILISVNTVPEEEERAKGDLTMNRVTSLTRQYPTVAFFILSFILTHPMNWIVNSIFEATQSIPLALPFAILSAGPLVSALLVSAMIGGKAEVVALLRKFTLWRVSWRWYAVAIFLLPALHLAAIYLNILLGAPAPTFAAFGTLSGLLGAFALRLVNPWDGPMLEELGWRGFAQPRLQKLYTPLAANLILSLLVTLWHLPLISSGQYTWIYIPGTIAATVLFGWVYNATGGSVLLTLIMHAAEPLLWVSFSAADETRAMGLLVLVYVVTATIVVLVTGKNLGRKATVPSHEDLEKMPATA